MTNLTVNNSLIEDKEELAIITRFTQVLCLFAIGVYLFYIAYGIVISRLEISYSCAFYMIGALVALLLNTTGKNSAAKVVIITNAAFSVVFTYQTFTIGFWIYSIFLPIFLSHIYLFDFDKEHREFLLSIGITTSLLFVNFFLERFTIWKVELTGITANQTDLIHTIVSLVITGFLLIVIVQNRTRINRKLIARTQALEEAISKLTETQDQLIQTEKMASLGLLAAGINHEINNPLNFIAGGLENLKQLKEKKTLNDLDEYLHVFEEGVDRIQKIVNSLNHFNYQSSSNEMRCDIVKILDNCLNILDHQIKGMIKIEKEYSCECQVKGNTGQLHQVFVNLLSNAIQAIQTKGVITITTTLHNKEHIKVSISDNGIGMTPAIKNRIFDPFFTTKEPGKGTGLGLSVSYKIISDHGGKIDLKTAPGKGTEFIISLPVHKDCETCK